MMPTSFLRGAALLGLLTAALASCNTGTTTGDTNVEQDATKNSDPATLSRNTTDSTTAGLRPDSATVTGQDMYEQAGEAKDRNNDGIAE